MNAHDGPLAPAPPLEELGRVRDEFTRFMMSYKFGIDEVMTKINILREEFSYANAYNPIEHVGSRLKSPESIVDKALRKNCPVDFDQMRKHIRDIAGVRVTCSFLSDVFRVRDMLVTQRDLTLLDERDYIANPKENGYKSLHLIVEVPVFMSDRVQPVVVEIQIRTIAMDFWAALEHKIYYKYDHGVPRELTDQLKQAAEDASRLDVTMEQLHEKVAGLHLDGDPALKRRPRASDAVELRDSLLERFAQHRSEGLGWSRFGEPPKTV